MPWQDWVFSIGGFILLISMVPTLRGEQKPALSTCIISTILIAVFALTMASLGLWLSAVANTGMSLTWGVLGVQRYRQTRRPLIEQLEEEVIETLETGDPTNAEPEPARP